jgi:hypothetical protein
MGITKTEHYTQEQRLSYIGKSHGTSHYIATDIEQCGKGIHANHFATYVFKRIKKCGFD